MDIKIKKLYEDCERIIHSMNVDSPAVKKSREIVHKVELGEKAYYGINTGLGVLASKRISPAQIKMMQKKLLQSHAVGVGDLMPRPIARLMLMLKIISLQKGYSGISKDTLVRMRWMLEHDYIPTIPSKGSVGASGDLAPLAHMSLPLIGLGEFMLKNGEVCTTQKIYKKHKLKALELHAKEGLALINGTQMMAAYGAYILERVHAFLRKIDIVAMMSLEALQGSIVPFDARIHKLRPHQGQKIVAQNLRKILRHSEILPSHRNCGKVQDPYCLRCVPQVHGASWDALEHAMNVVEVELNSVTDNPLIFDNGDILSGGNFHGQPLALVLDFAAIALAEIASISERRTYLLLEGNSGLPKLLMEHTGVNTGFMIPQYTAASLVSENKVLCHPSSVDSIPTSLGQEDHVSMGSIGALKLLQVFENVQTVLAIEMVCACQALDYRFPLKPGKGVEAAHAYVRRKIEHTEKDIQMHKVIASGLSIIKDDDWLHQVESSIGPLK